MQISKLSYFLSALLIISVSLNGYLFRRAGINSIDDLMSDPIDVTNGFDDKLDKLSSDHSYKEREELIIDSQAYQDTSDRSAFIDLQRLFENGDYDAAWLGLSQSALDEVGVLKTDWLNACYGWLRETPNASYIDHFIESGLQLYPDDIELRQLDAERLFVRQEYLEAIERLYILLRESDIDLQEPLQARIEQIVQQHVKQLSHNNAWQSLVDFTGRLLWHEPNKAAYIFIHAQALAKLQRYDEAKSKLYLITNDTKYGVKSRKLINKIEKTVLNAKLKRKAIPLQAIGPHHIVNGFINNTLPINLMIDTGASSTVISVSAFNAIQQTSSAVFVRDAAINTAGGRVMAPVYRVNSFRVDDFEVRDIELVVMDLDTGNAGQGLLGMNFLRNFDFKIDQQQNALILAPNN